MTLRLAALAAAASGSRRGSRTRSWGAAEKIEVLFRGEWRPAKVLRSERGITYVHYEGESDVYDEWVGPGRIRPAAGR